MRLAWASGGSVTTSGTQIDSILAPCNTGGLGFLAVLLAHVVFGVNGTVDGGIEVVPLDRVAVTRMPDDLAWHQIIAGQPP